MVANPNPTPNKSSASSRTRQPNNQLLQKKRGGVHPDIVSHLRNTPPWIIPKSNDKKTYGTLTDESTYSEYAWEFLRRNRFYQALIDKTKPAFDENDWGYRREPEAFPVYGIYGLPPKRYDEAYAQGKPVEWYGIHDFVRDRLNIMSRPGGRNNTPLEHVRSQIEIIFDFGPVFGPGTPAIEIQIALAQEKLKELAGKFASELEKKTGVSIVQRKNAPKKEILRAQLRIVDLLSEPEALVMAQQSRAKKTPGNANPQPRNPATDSQRSKLQQLKSTKIDIKDAAKFLPDFDLRRKKNSTLTTTQLEGRASELAVAAYKSIYEWQCLNWLQFDDWITQFPHPKAK
jgi:hypothetical protein